MPGKSLFKEKYLLADKMNAKTILTGPIAASTHEVFDKAHAGKNTMAMAEKGVQDTLKGPINEARGMLKTAIVPITAAADIPLAATQGAAKLAGSPIDLLSKTWMIAFGLPLSIITKIHDRIGQAIGALKIPFKKISDVVGRIRTRLRKTVPSALSEPTSFDGGVAKGTGQTPSSKG